MLERMLAFLGVAAIAAIDPQATVAQTTARARPAASRTNPLLARSPLPFQAPQFDKIKDSDFAPAFDAAMKQHLVEIEKIANNSARPTFENTLVALERSGQALTRVQLAFNALTSS